MSKNIIFIIVILVFLMSCLVIFKLLNQRNEIKNQYILEKEEQKKMKIQHAMEGLSILSSDKTTESKTIATQIYYEIQNSPTNSLTTQNQNNNYYLNEISVFSSWNTACSGTFVSTDQIINVLGSGCRMLHFTISNYNDKPTIFGDFIDSKNGVLLQDALQICMDKAFSYLITLKTNSGDKDVNLTNYKDPLIVMLSFKYFTKDDIKKYDKSISKNSKTKLSNPYYTTEFINKCADIVDTVFNNRLYNNGDGKAININQNVQKNQINEKTIIITDLTGLSQEQIKFFNASKLNSYSNLVCGVNPGITIYPFKDLSLQNIFTSNNNCNNSNFIMAVPVSENDKNSTLINPTRDGFINCSFYQKCQFIPIVFYSSDFKYIIQFFRDNNSAFVSFQTINNELLHPNSKAVMI